MLPHLLPKPLKDPAQPYPDIPGRHGPFAAHLPRPVGLTIRIQPSRHDGLVSFRQRSNGPQDFGGNFKLRDRRAGRLADWPGCMLNDGPSFARPFPQ